MKHRPLFFAVLLLGAVSADAAVKTWVGLGATGNWSDANNWNGGTVFQSGDSFYIDGGTSAARVPYATTNVNNLPTGTVVSGITLTGYHTNLSTSGNVGKLIKLNGNVSREDGGNSTIYNPIELIADSQINVAANRQLVFYQSAISGSYGLTKVGQGSMVMRGESTFTGGILLEEGTLGPAGNNVNHFGTGKMTITSGTLQMIGASVGVSGLAGTGGVIENAGSVARTFTVQTGNLAGDTYAGVIRDGGTVALNFVKSGAGLLTLSGNNSYTGTTTISGGTLLVSGGGAITDSVVAVGAGAMLGGAGGSISQAVTVQDGGALVFSLAAPSATHLSLGSQLTLAGNNDLKLTLDYAAALNDQFTLLSVAGTRSGTFATINGEAVGPENLFTLAFNGSDYTLQLGYNGGDVVATVVGAVPEPSSLILIGAALGGAFCLRRRVL